MPDAEALRISDLSGGQNDTRDPILLADSELAKCRNVLWRNGRLETRRGHIEVKHIKFEQNENADITSATTIGLTGWTVIDDEFNGYTVEIYSGTGSPQTQTITDSTQNVADGYVTVADWDGVIGDPGADSDFRIYAEVKKLYRYIKQDGTEILLAHTGKHIFKSTDGTTWAQVVILKNDGTTELIFTLAAQMSFITYQGKVFGFNGTENVWSYDGTNTFVYNRDEDPGAATGAGAVGKTNLIDSDLTEANDYWNNFKIYFLDPTTVNFDLSRTVTDFLAATDEVQFAAVEIATKDTEKYYMGPDIPKAAYATVCQRRIFALMRSDDNCWFSGLDDYWYWPSTSYFVTEVGEGQRNTGIVDYLGKLIVFKERTTVKYDVSLPFPQQWSKETISTNIGCAHNDSIQVLAIEGVDHLVWLSYEGFCIMGPDWQVRNISKDRLDVLVNDLQMPVYNYLQKVWTTTGDFTGTEDPANSIDQTGDEFTLVNATQTWDDQTGFEAGTLTDLKAANDKLEIDFTEAVREENSSFVGSETWVDLMSAEESARVQTFQHDGGLLVTKVSLYLKKIGTGGGVAVKIKHGDVVIASGYVGHGSITEGWVDFTMAPANALVGDNIEHRISVTGFEDVGGVTVFQWKHEDPGGYANGKSDQDTTGDYGFKVSGYNASGTWESETIDTTWTSPEYGDFDVTETGTEGIAFVQYLINAKQTDAGWTTGWRVIWKDSHIVPLVGYRYFRIRAILLTDIYNESPTVDDVDVPYCVKTASLTGANYQQTSSYDEWGHFDTSQTRPRYSGIAWYCETADSSGGLDGSNWIEILPGDKIQAPSSDDWVHWKCTLIASNASDLPSIQDVTISWLDWTAGGTLTAIISSGIWDDTYWFLGAERDSTSNNIVIVIDKRGSLWPMDITMNTIAQFKNMLYGGDTNGKVYYMDVGLNDNGSAYTPYAETKEFGSPEIEYLHNAFDAVLEKMGSYDLTVGYVIDPTLGSSGVLTYTTLATIDLSGAGTLAERVRFDSTNNLVGHFIRFKFSTAAANNPWMLYGFSVWRLAFGLRGDANAEAAQTTLDPARHID